MGTDISPNMITMISVGIIVVWGVFAIIGYSLRKHQFEHRTDPDTSKACGKMFVTMSINATSTVTMLGVLGTFVGFGMGLQGSPAFSTNDPAATQIFLSSLINGFSIAVWSSVAGVACSVLLRVFENGLLGKHLRSELPSPAAPSKT